MMYTKQSKPKCALLMSVAVGASSTLRHSASEFIHRNNDLSFRQGCVAAL